MIGSVALLYFGLGAALVLFSGISNIGFWPASYSVFLVLIAAAWLLSVADLLRRNYQLYMSILVSLAVGFALIHPSIIHGSEMYYLVHEGTIFVMVIVFLGLNLLLPWALMAAVAGAVIAAIIVVMFDLSVDWGMSSSTYLGGSLLGMVLRYRDERHLRREHLHARLLVLDNERIQALANQLERLSFIDGLTGLANRRYFDSSLDKAWRSCHRDGTPLTVIMLDVDFFKPYNDFYGHQRGDQVLRDLAQTISAQAVRPQDMVARYGGEEFVVLLPAVDEESAQQMAEKILQAVRERNLIHQKSDCADHVTVSAGIATRIPLPHMHPETLVAAADAALYQAKRDGRDCWRRSAE
ncbi:MAG: GGDEF domain-containing protein [Alcanivoracaceae bacterium]|jgi:diguanylate cyclase (GGDEF)-like protein|nr:GGDEF domain-containing protein [Alcanivoracaceae bacterium]